MQNLNFYSLKYILILFPALLLTGPFLPDLFLSLIAIIYIFKISKQSGWHLLWSKTYNKYFILLYLILVIGSILSEFQIYSLKSSFFYFRYFFFFNAIIDLLDEDEKIIKKISFLTFISLLIASFDTIFQSQFGFNMLGYETNNSSRMGSFFGDELIVGSYLSRLSPLLIIFFFCINSNKFKLNFYLFSILIFIGSGIFLSGERTALFLFLLTFVTIFFVKKFRYGFYITCILSLLILPLSNNLSKDRMFNQTINQIYDKERGKIYFFSKEHTILSKISVEIFKNNKFFGAGAKNFRNVCDDEKYKNLVDFKPDHYCNFHPHNIFFQFLSETGFFGTTTYLFFLFYIIYKILRTLLNFRNDKENKNGFILLFSAIGVLISIFPLVPSGQFFNNWLSIYLYIYLGIFLYFDKKYKFKTLNFFK